MALPEFDANGDLPPGVHRARLREIVARFATSPPRRRILGDRITRIVQTAHSTGHVARLVVFGSFVTDKPEPNDVDVFLLMEDSFDVELIIGEPRLLFDHLAAQAHFGASIFWMRRTSALDGEQAALEYWQIKRDGQLRGIVEIVGDQS